MTGRVVIVTGAGSGLGWHITQALLAQGDTVIANYATSGDLLNSRVTEVGADRLVPVKGSIADESTSEELAAEAAQLGGPQAVIHNASITRDGLLVKMSLQDWQAVQDVNLAGAFLLSKHAVRKMLRHRVGRLVYISSISAVMGNAGQANYAASKSGLDGLARSVAQEYASRGISACVLAAGLIDVGMGARLTPQIQAAKLAKILGGGAKPEEIAAIAAFLASDAARYINATVVHANGGIDF
jgi:3-oxoacyl-[acyl-carrier protein] reductase